MEMGRNGNFAKVEAGPMRMEMEFEDGVKGKMRMGDTRMRMEANDDGVRLVMENAKALLTSAATAAAMAVTMY